MGRVSATPPTGWDWVDFKLTSSCQLLDNAKDFSIILGWMQYEIGCLNVECFCSLLNSYALNSVILILDGIMGKDD